MIEIFIFYLHVVGFIYAYVKRWQEGGTKEGVLAVSLLGLVFTIGWALSGAMARLVTPEGGFASWFTADTLSLLLLLVPEILIFYAFFVKVPTAPPSDGTHQKAAQ